MSNKVSRNNGDILTREITSEKVRGNNVDFSTIEITLKTWIFRPSKLLQKKYVETMWIF